MAVAAPILSQAKSCAARNYPSTQPTGAEEAIKAVNVLDQRVGERLRSRRLKMGLSQSELGREQRAARRRQIAIRNHVKMENPARCLTRRVPEQRAALGSQRAFGTRPASAVIMHPLGRALQRCDRERRCRTGPVVVPPTMLINAAPQPRQ